MIAMKKLLLFVSLVTTTVAALSQGQPYPNYQPQGNSVTRWSQQGAVQGVKGIINGIYPDTATANIGYIDYYPGAQIFTTNDKFIWVRDFPAVRWIRQSPTITSFTFNTDSSIVVCYGNGVCDTLSMFNFTTVVNNIVQNFNDSTIYNINDSTIVICNLAGSCDTIDLGTTNIYNIYTDSLGNQFVVTCDTLQFICVSGTSVGDSCYQQQLCDTIPIEHLSAPFYQNLLRVLPGTTVREHGSAQGDLRGQMIHDTWAYLGYNKLTFEGYSIERPMVTFDQQQWNQFSSSILSLNHYGTYPPDGRIDSVNRVNLYFNYFNKFVFDTTGFMHDRIGYPIITNARGSRYSLGIDNANSKQTGVMLHTLDTAYTDAVTIFGNQTPNQYAFSVSPFPTSTLLDSRIAIFKTDKEIQFPGYPSTRDDGGTAKALYTDAEGNVRLGPVTGGDIITIINDTTITICSFGNNLCDTFIVNNIGVLQTVTIINDSTLLVCDSLNVCDTLHIPQTVLSQPITANNGLIMSTPTNVQLGAPVIGGAPLLHNTFISSSVNTRRLNIDGVTTTADDGMLSVVTTGVGGNAIRGTSQSGGRGVYGIVNGNGGVGVYGLDNGANTTGLAMFASTTNGVGIWARSYNYIAGQFTGQPAATNTVTTVLEVIRASSGGAGGTGIGGSIDFRNRTDASVEQLSNQIISKLTNAVNASRTGQLIITGVNNAVTADLFTLSGNGETRLNKYGVGTFTAGTATYLIASKADGSLMEYPPGGISGGLLLSADNGLSVRSSTTAVLGQNEAEVGNPAILLNNREIPMGGFLLSLNASATQAVNILQTKNAAAAVRARVTSAASFSNTGGQTGAEIFGDLATVTGANGIVFGNNSTAAANGVAIGAGINSGVNILISNGGVGTNISAFSAAVSVGGTITGNNGTSVGASSSAANSAVAIGTSATASSTGATAVGGNTVASGANSLALNGQAAFSESIGIQGITTAANQLVIGRDVVEITEAYIGTGVTSNNGGFAGSIVLNATGGVGTNVVGGNFTIAGGKGTGNAAGGVIIFQTSTAVASGTTLQSLANKIQINGSGILAYNGVMPTSGSGGTDSAIFRNSSTGQYYLAPGSAVITADNGLSKNTATNVQLGGTLIQSTTITVAGQTLNVSNNSAATSPTFINSAASGVALTTRATNATGVGLVWENNSGSASSIAAEGISYGVVLRLTNTGPSTNDAVNVLSIFRASSGGVGANGIGATIDFSVETSSANQISNQLISQWVDATNATRTSQFLITGVTTASTETWLTIGQSGYVKFRPMTVTEAGAIATAEGLMVFVSNTDATFTSVGLWIFQNGAWKAL